MYGEIQRCLAGAAIQPNRAKDVYGTSGQVLGIMGCCIDPIISEYVKAGNVKK